MKVFFTSCLSIIVFTLGTSYVSAATYHLSPTGNDTNNGSSTSPWKTINKANQTASSGDTIILKNGIYQGSGQAYQALTKAGVTWQAENKHQAIIDGGFSPESLNGDWRNIVTAWNARCTNLGQWSRLMSVQGNNITIDGLFLRNSCGGGILIADDVVNATFKNSKIDWTFIAGFYADGETTNLQVLNNEMTRISFNDEYKQYNGEGYGVNISIHMSGENMVVRDNIIAFGRGEIAMTGARNLLFENNVVVANKNNFYNGWADGVIVRNNLFWAPDANKHPGTHWEKSNKNTNDWHLSSRNEYDNRWVNYASGLNNIAYYNNLIINNSVQFNGYHNKQGVTYSTNTTNVYFGHNTLVTGPHTTSLFKLSFNAIEGATGDSKITGIVESNIFDVSKDASEAFPISLSSNDSVTFRNNIMPTSAPSSMKGPGDVYRNSAGLVNALAVLDFPIPAAGAPSVNMSGLRNAVNLNNYRLTNTSVAINAGFAQIPSVGTIPNAVLSLAKEQDYLKLARVGTPDIGAFEYTGANQPTPPPSTPTPTENPSDPTPTSTPSPTTTVKLPFFDKDQDTDWLDILLFVPRYALNNRAKFDLNNNGLVDLFDYATSLFHFNATPTPTNQAEATPTSSPTNNPTTTPTTSSPTPTEIVPTPPSSNQNILIFSSATDSNDLNTKEIYTINPDGTNRTRLTNNSYDDEGAMFSPDKSKIAFKSNREGNFEIYVMNVDGSNVRRLTNNPAHDQGVSWSPDGSKIAFGSDRDGDFEIYIMNNDGTNTIQLTKNTLRDRTANWSPDGSKIAYTCSRGSRNVNGKSVTDLDICTINPDGTGEVNLTVNDNIDQAIAGWHPDGAKIVYRHGNANNYDVYVMSATGNNPTNISNHPKNDMGPTWSPDGTQIAFSSDRDGNSEMYIMNANSSNQTKIINLPDSFEDDIDW